MNNHATQQVALVTGANKGLGLEIARQLGMRGITVLVGARDERRGHAAVANLRDGGIDAHYVHLDVTDEPSIAGAADRIDREFGYLDILVNNAGVSLEQGRKPSEVPLEVMRRVYDTNVFGVVSVTNLMLPLLRKAPAARVVNMSSSMGSLAQWSDPSSMLAQFAPLALAYNSSKTALNAITVQYAREVRDSPIKINAACPGYVATDLNHHSGTRTVAEGAGIAVTLATLPADGPSGAFMDENGPVPW